jgi:superfamily II DNA or RNA helicase
MSIKKLNYQNLYVPKDSRSMDEICDTRAFSYQKQQLFVQRWFSSGHKKLLLFHGLGSGKTCSSILAIQSLKSRISHVYVVTPAALKDNYKKELKSECGKYNSPNLSKSITIISHNGFVKMDPKLDNCLVVIDEVQNVVSSTGLMYKTYFDMLVTRSPKNLHVVLLSATPMFDQPHEIALTLNLLNLNKPLPVLKFYTEYLNKNKSLKNIDDFNERISGYVSAFKGISPNAYAKRTDTTYLCNMSQHQYGSYTNSVQGLTMNNVAFSQAFLSGPRVASNIVYESGGFGTKYRPTDQTLKKQLVNLKKLSTKFYRCIKTLNKIQGPAFVYSNFVASGGINDFAIALKVNGYREIRPLQGKPKSVAKRFGVFRTGKDKENSALVSLFNSAENKNGKLIKVILGSPAMKEGISLKNTRSVHLLDPYWNRSRTEQIIGRAIRFCSHVGLPKDQRSVNVYHYISNIQNQKRKTVDQHIMHMSNEKAQLIHEFEMLLYKAAVDCTLFHKVNGLQLVDCTKLNKSMINSRLVFETPTKLKVSLSGDSLEEEKESKLKELLNMQVVRIGNQRQRYGFKITLYTPNDVDFSFIDNGLSRMIHSQNWIQSNGLFAKVSMDIRPKQKSSSIKNNNLGLKHLGFNKGKKVSKVYKIAGGGKKVKPEYVGCPKQRRPDEKDQCPQMFPYKRQNEKTGKSCCYKKPTHTKGLVKTNNGKVYINGKIAKTLTYKQLSEAASSFGKQIAQKMRKSNIINLLKD